MADAEALKNDKTTDVETGKSPKKLKKWHKIAIGIVVVIVGLVLIVNAATSGVTKTSNQYIDDIQSKNAAGAYSLMTKDAQATTTAADFQTLVEKIGPILNTKEKMTSKSVNGETGQAGTGIVTYEIKGTDGVTYNITVNLQKENGQWKVLNFKRSK